MKRFSIIILAALLGAASPVRAQWNVALFERGEGRTYVALGLDPAIVGTLGITKAASLLTRTFQVGGELSLAAGKRDAMDSRVRLALKAPILNWKSVFLTGAATAVARSTENRIYKAVNFGADLTAGLGVYRARWFAAAEWGRDEAIITHLENSQWYRDHVYPDAKDGWYLDAGGTVRLGLSTGVSIGRTELSLRVGKQGTEHHNDTVLPAYATLGIGRAF